MQNGFAGVSVRRVARALLRGGFAGQHYNLRSHEGDPVLASSSTFVEIPENTWQLLRVRVAGYPAGARRAIVMLGGKDAKFWAGHYGAKFLGPCLHFDAAGDGMEGVLEA